MLLFEGISWSVFTNYLLVFLAGYYGGVFTGSVNLAYLFASRKKTEKPNQEATGGEVSEGDPKSELIIKADYTQTNSNSHSS